MVRPSFAVWANRAWRPALVILLGIGIWVALRWAASASPAPEPTLKPYMADGGGGAIEIWGIYAPQEYFRLAKRDPATLGLDPTRELVFFVRIDTHEHEADLPSPTTWWNAVSLSIDGKGDYRPWKQRLVLASEHHQTVALAFQQEGELSVSQNKGVLALFVPDPGDGATRAMRWRLPLSASAPPAPPRGFLPSSFGALLPLIAGLLVAFSPCVIHMTTYYLPLFGGVAGQKAAGDQPRRKVALVLSLFTLGFAIPYTVAGVVVGYVGQFAKDSSLSWVSQPLTLVAGAVVLYLGLQVSGVFRLPFLLRLNLPVLRSGQRGTGYLASGFLGLNLAVGCLGCVGGSLFAALLLYSGAAGSPVEGGAVLLLFALAANVPFFLAAITLGHFQLRSRIPLSVLRYVPVISGATLIALGLLILSGTESLLEDALIQALGIQGQG